MPCRDDAVLDKERRRDQRCLFNPASWLRICDAGEISMSMIR